MKRIIPNGFSNYTAQNLGAGISKRVKSGFKAGVKMVWIICIPIVALYLVASNGLIEAFMADWLGNCNGIIGLVL